MEELIKAIAVDIAKEFEHYIYLQDIGEGFKRPSFFIYHVSTKQVDINRRKYNNNILIKIVYFAPLSKYQLPIRLDQLATLEKLKKIFSNMGIRVGDNWIRISDMAVNYTEDKDIFLQLTLDKEEFREDIFNNENNFETMKNIYIRESGI